MPINSSSTPALMVARSLRRKRRAAGGGVTDGLQRVYVGDNGNDDASSDQSIQYDPMSGVPIGGQVSPEAAPVPEPQSRFSRMVNRLIGTQFGEPRHQLWPEKMVRSGTSLAGDVLTGQQNVLPPGLRREDYTDTPAPSAPTEDSTWLGRVTGLPPVAAQPNDPMMERAQDMAGLAGGQTLLTGAREAAPVAQRALVAAADSQATGAPLAALEHAPKFYSALERAVETIPQPTMTGQQWLGTLNNRGIKAEEMQWTGLGDYLSAKGNQPVTKAEVAQHLGSNKMELGETSLGIPSWEGLTPEQQYKVHDAWKDSRYPGNFDNAKEYFNDVIKPNADEFGGIIPNRARYSEYQLPGGENYREKLLTLPTSENRFGLFRGEDRLAPDVDFATGAHAREFDLRGRGIDPNGASVREIESSRPNYRSSHWDEPNVLAHRRTNERSFDIPFTPEEAASAEANRAGSQQLEALRQQQGAVGKEINAAVRPLEHAYFQDLYSKTASMSPGDARRALEAPPDFPQIKPLKDKLQALRAEEDALRKSLGPEPKPKTGRSLHIEEIQSDWHQAGRKQGYKELSPSELAELNQLTKREINPNSKNPLSEVEKTRIAELERKNGDVPNAPFKKNWHELVLKDALREAAEKGLDRISWTPGEAQAARYDLSKQMDTLRADPNRDGTFNLSGMKNRGVTFDQKNVARDKVADYVGKDMAEKLLNSDKNTYGMHELTGVDLKVGGEGMKGFYDKIIPDTLNKIGKRHGVKVESGITRVHPSYWADGLNEPIHRPEQHAPIHYMDIPKSLKDDILQKGFSLFEDSATAGVPLAAAEPGNKDAELVAALQADQESDANKKKRRRSVVAVPERKDGGGVNAAMDVARKVKRARGGKVHIGPIVGPTGGRADKVPMEVPNGSYILTADLVSGLGEGNTEAGFEKLKKMFPKSTAAYKAAKANPPKRSGDNVPIMAAHGEYSVCPEDIVDRWGDLDKGHRILDHWQTTERKKLIETLKGLAPPAQD